MKPMKPTANPVKELPGPTKSNQILSFSTPQSK